MKIGSFWLHFLLLLCKIDRWVFTLPHSFENAFYEVSGLKGKRKKTWPMVQFMDQGYFRCF